MAAHKTGATCRTWPPLLPKLWGKLDSQVRILLDLDLPDGSGLEVLRYVRTKGIEASVAIFTGNPSAADLWPLKPDAVFHKGEIDKVQAWLRC